MRTLNIKYDLDIELSKYNSFSPKVLYEYFSTCLINSGFSVEKSTKIKGLGYQLFVSDKTGKLMIVNVVLRNVTDSGWVDKPDIKRCQVRNVANYDKEFLLTSKPFQTTILVGLYNYDNNPIFVAWDINQYLAHRTQCSCYVSVESLKSGYRNRFFKSIDSKKPVWVFGMNEFGVFINDFIKYREASKHEK